MELVSAASRRNQQGPPKYAFRREMYLLCCLLRFIGAAPLSGQVGLKFDVWLLACMLINSTMLLLMCYLIWHVLHIVLNSDMEFNDNLIYYCTLVFIFLPFIALIIFRERTKIGNMYKRWTDLEDYYYNVTGTPLRLSVRKMLILTVIITCLCAVNSGQFSYVMFKDNIEELSIKTDSLLPYVGGLYYGYVFWLIYILAVSWYFFTLVLRQAARQVFKQLQVCYEEGRSLDELRTLWMLLRATTISTSSALGYLMICYLTCSTSMLMGSVYGSLAVSSFALGGFYRIYMPAFCLVSVTLVGEFGYRTVREIGPCFHAYLLDALTTERRPKMREELQVFLHYVDTHAPVFNLAGFMTVDRVYNNSVIGTLASFVIIVLQFNGTVTNQK